MAERNFSQASQTTGQRTLSLTQLDAYYRGAQPLSFLHPAVDRALGARLRSLVVNIPGLVVDSIEERLDVEGFLLGEDEADENLWRIWQANDLDESSQQCHTDALVLGRSFVMVWPDPEDESTPRITVESAQQIEVKLDPATRQVVEAVKEWRDEDVVYRTVYTRTSITKHRSEIDGGAEEVIDVIENPFGVVPVVPFVNRPSVMHPLGTSEMSNVLPIADAINKLCTDMMVSAEYHAMPRRWATGVETGGSDAEAERTAAEVERKWTNAQAGKVWLSDAADAKFGQFAEASLENFVSAVKMLTSQAAALSGLPPQYLGLTTENPASADAIRSAEATLVKRALRKQRVFGGAWERVMRLALLMSGDLTPAAASMETLWRDPNTPTLAQTMDAVVKGVQVGVLDPIAGQELVGLTPKQRAAIAARGEATPGPSAPATEAPRPPDGAF